jgi:DNA-binding MarR family transcriptional regulator
VSAKATAWAWDQAINSHSAKLVLLCLADSHDGCSGRVDADLVHIAKMTGLSQKTVRASLARLEKNHLVTPTRLTVSATGFSLQLVGGNQI